jgi:hypothetical protein
MNNAERPAVAGMGKDFSAQTVIIVPQAIADRLGVAENGVLIQGSDRGITHVPSSLHGVAPPSYGDNEFPNRQIS